MEVSYIGERIAKLRTIKNISARAMSITIGQSENYINKIENGVMLPSMATFFDICDYLEISLKDFFDEDTNDPIQVNEMITEYKRLSSNAQSQVKELVKEMNREK